MVNDYKCDKSLQSIRMPYDCHQILHCCIKEIYLIIIMG